MKQEKIGLKFKDKKIKLNVKRVSEFEKGIGLMFCRREKAKALLFEFKKAVKWNLHSLFVFFPFLILWLDEENKIVDLRIVKPWKISISSLKKYNKIIEIPLNKKYKEIVKILVGLRNI